MSGQQQQQQQRRQTGQELSLEEVNALGFSVGSVLMPRDWTVDTHSHSVPVCSSAHAGGAEGDCDNDAAAVAAAMCCSSNTVRAEQLDTSGVGGRGAVIYLSEVYVPRAAGEALSVHAQRECLLSACSSAAQGEAASPWVSAVDVGSLGAPLHPTSVAAQLLPSFHVLLQIVVLAGAGEGREAPRRLTDLADTVLSDAVRRLTSPLADLLPPLHDGPGGDERHIARSRPPRRVGGGCGGTWWGTAAAQLTGEGEPFFDAGVLSERGGAVVSLQPWLSQRGAPAPAPPSLFDVAWSCGRARGTRLGVDDSTAVARLRHLAKHELRLSTGEEAVVAVDPRDGLGGDAVVDAVGVALFPLSLRDASIFSFPSVERSFERHVTASLAVNASKAGRLPPSSSPSPTAAASAGEISSEGDAVWECVRVCTSARFTPSESFMEAVAAVEEEEMAMELSLNTTRRHAMPSVPAGRHTVFAVTRRQQQLPSTGVAGAGAGAGRGGPGYLLQLVAPRVHSDAAMVLIASVVDASPAALAAAAAWLPGAMAVRYPTAAAWTSVVRGPLLGPASASASAASTVPASFVFRQGQLALRLPAGDVRYRGARVVPTASQCFATLGSMTVVVVAAATAAAAPSSSSPLSSAASSPVGSPALAAADAAGRAGHPFAATWTLLADGRGAADYLDFVLTEAFYSSGAYTLGNAGQRHTALKLSRDVVHVRERGKNATHQRLLLQRRRAEAGRRAGPAHGPAMHALGGAAAEVWSAWVDVGAARRVFVCAQERDVDQLLVVQAILDSEQPRGSSDGAAAEALQVQRRAEAALEEWVFGVAVGTLPRF